jgi:hypothetical protein
MTLCSRLANLSGRSYSAFMEASDVTAKTATPTKADSKLSDAHLELLERREGEGGMPLRPGVVMDAVHDIKHYKF